MRVALLFDSFSVGGGQEHVYQICLGMKDVEFGVFGKTGSQMERFNQLPNVTVFNTNFIRRELNLFNPDILHFHHIRPALKCFWYSRPKIFTIHGVHIHQYEFKKGFSNKILFLFRFMLEKFLYSWMTKIICVSNGDSLFVKKLYSLKSVETVINDIDVSHISKSIQPMREARISLNLELDNFIFLMIGRFDFPKGQDLLIESIIRLKMKGKLLPNMKFVFVGSGVTENSLKIKVKNAGIDNYVEFRGFSKLVGLFMSACDVLICPSRWEGYPITVIEAMACGVPMILSKTYGHIEFSHLADEIKFFPIQEKIALDKAIIDYYNSPKDRIVYPLSQKTMLNNLNRIYASTI